jgi:hypothetical protein
MLRHGGCGPSRGCSTLLLAQTLLAALTVRSSTSPASHGHVPYYCTYHWRPHHVHTAQTLLVPHGTGTGTHSQTNIASPPQALLDAGACIAQRDRRGRCVLDYAPDPSEARSLLQARLSSLEARAAQLQRDLLASLELEEVGGSPAGGQGGRCCCACVARGLRARCMHAQQWLRCWTGAAGACCSMCRLQPCLSPSCSTAVM